MPTLTRARTAVTVVFAAHGALFASFAPRIPGVKDGLDLSAGALGVALLAPAAGALVSMPLTGAASVRFGSAATTRALFAAYCALPWTVGLAGELGTLWLGLFGWGLAIGGLDVAMNAQGVTVEKTYGRPVLSSFHAGWSIGALIGTGIGSACAAVDVDLAVQLAIGGAVLFVAVFPLLRPMLPDRDADAPRPPPFAVPSGRLLLLGAAAFAGLVCEGAAADWSAVHLTESLDASDGLGGAAYGAFTAMMTIGRLVGDRIVAALGRERSLQLLGAIGALGMAGGLLSESIVGAVVGFAILGFGLSAMVPTIFGAAGESEAAAGPAIAAVSTCGYFGWLLGPSMIGGLAELVGLTGALWLVPALTATAGLLGRASRRPTPEGV